MGVKVPNGIILVFIVNPGNREEAAAEVLDHAIGK